MPRTTYFKVDRGLLKHPLWKSEVFAKGQAWIDLVGSANHAAGYLIIKGKRIDLERGQYGASMETLKVRWKWSRGKVSRFLNFLENELMIVQQRGNLTTIITICNYETYQCEYGTSGKADGKADGKALDKADGHQTVRQTDIKRDTNNKNKELKKNEKEEDPLTPKAENCDETMGALKKCRDVLGLGDEEIKNIHSRYDDEAIIEAVQCAIERTEEIMDKTGEPLDSPAGYINYCLIQGKKSKKTRMKLISKDKQPYDSTNDPNHSDYIHPFARAEDDPIYIEFMKNQK